MGAGTPLSYALAGSSAGEKKMGFPFLAAATVISGIIGGATAKGPESARLQLPPALEIDYLRNSQQLLDQIQSDIQKTYNLEKVYNQRLDVVDKAVKGILPDPKQIKYLDDANIDEFGNLRDIESEGFKDPVLENQLQTEKSSLEQELARKGISPAQRLQALNQFNKIADERRFTRTEELRTNKTQRGLARLSAGQDLSGSLVNRALQGGSALAQTAGQRFQAGQAAIEGRRVLGAQGQDTFKQLGQTKFSEEVRGLLKNGQIDTGGYATDSYNGQTQYGNVFNANTGKFEQGVSGPVSAGVNQAVVRKLKNGAKY